MKTENVVYCPPCGESTAKRGINKEILRDNPPSALRATSPAGGEVNGGFTLIELLVVVLIIGILAAVALPQYQKAVIKSRLTQGIVFAKAVHDAEEVYYLANGSYTDSFEKLDVDVTCPADWTCELNANRMAMKLPSKFVSSGSSLEIVYSHTKRSDDKGLANILYCVAPQNTPEAIICEGMGKYFGRNDNGFVRYQLH